MWRNSSDGEMTAISLILNVLISTKNNNIVLMFIQYKLFTHVPHTVHNTYINILQLEITK